MIAFLATLVVLIVVAALILWGIRVLGADAQVQRIATFAAVALLIIWCLAALFGGAPMLDIRG